MRMTSTIALAALLLGGATPSAEAQGGFLAPLGDGAAVALPELDPAVPSPAEFLLASRPSPPRPVALLLRDREDLRSPFPVQRKVCSS